jgi:hypothetical protein
MSNVVRFPRKTEASKLRVASMAADAIASLKKAGGSLKDQARARRDLAQAAENARRAIREMHYIAAQNGERLWAARVVRTELELIVEHIKEGDL